MVEVLQLFEVPALLICVLVILKLWHSSDKQTEVIAKQFNAMMEVVQSNTQAFMELTARIERLGPRGAGG